MRKAILFISVSILAVLLCGCSESKNETILSVDKQTVYIPSDGGTEKFHITCNTSWTITTDNTDITISPKSGSGDADVSVSLPMTWSIKETEIRLMVSTGDGAVVQNVKVIQKTKYTSGAILQINNHGDNNLFLGGESHAVDSIHIQSNIPWQMKGPEWVEAYDGSKWVALSETRSMIVSDNKKLDTETHVILRSAKQNTSSDDLVGKIVVTPQYDGDVKAEIDVVQLGKYSVTPDRTMRFVNSMACNWKKGTAVKKFLWGAFKKELTEAELTDSNISKWDEYDINYIGSVNGLQPDTKYYYYTAGIDASGKYHVNKFVLKTAKDENQPLAVISNVAFDGTYLTYDITRNDNCDVYLEAVFTDGLSYGDALLAWYIYYNDPDGVLRIEDDVVGARAKINNDVQIVTWGVAKGTNMLAAKLSRHFTSYFSSASARLATGMPVIEKASLKELDNKFVSIRRIKTQ